MSALIMMTMDNTMTNSIIMMRIISDSNNIEDSLLVVTMHYCTY